MDFDAHTIRLFLHVLAASVWVGGQIVVAALLPTLRTLGEDVPAKVAAAFSRVAWPFFWLAVVTGIWNLSAIDLVERSNSYQVGVMFKLLIVAASGVAAFAHSSASSRQAKAIWGALGGVAAVAALLFGVILVAHA